jgi:DNA topoisomerase III
LSPLLFDLTSLQREANSRFGLPAKRTLGIAQALYERHKVLTYPRTDSRALPEDYVDTVKKTMSEMGATQFGRFADEILKEGWVRANKRIFNNAKVSDHFAIIPTTLMPKNLDEDEAKIYDTVTRRFLAVFYPAAEFLITTRITRVEGEPFKSEGKVLVKPGWLAIYGREAQLDGDNSPQLAPVQPNEQVRTEKIEVVSLQTKPPARFSEATLLSAMEGAGKLVEDEELREAMSAKGLGTPATRAAIIEGLIMEKYINRNGRELQATAKGISLITLLRGLGIPELCSPELTGNWEFKLKQMERGELQRPDFMAQIAEMTRAIVDKTKQYESDTVPGDFSILKVPCPKCGGTIKETYKAYQCSNCDFSMWKIVAGRQMEVEEAEELLRERKIGPLQGFRSKMGRPFAAIIKMNAEHKPEFDFGPGSGGEDGQAQEVDFSGLEPVGKCPKCQSNVYDSGMAYICEKAVGPNRKCDFRSGKVILQRQMTREEMVKLLTTGKTDLLHKFISKKNRPFSAYLVLGKDGKVSFEFEPRAPKAPGAKGRGRAKKAEPGADAGEKSEAA